MQQDTKRYLSYICPRCRQSVIVERDLFSLAATDKILGSYWSSFTDVAASMRGIPKVIVGEDA